MKERIFKFRAWDNKDKTMFYDVQMGICFDDGSHYGFKRFLGYQEKDDYHEWSLMQFTGLKDKNGKKIYEGDILKTKDVPNIEVYWSNEDGGFMGRYLEKTNSYCHINDSVNFASEIIGNIMENPELLKESK